jgi:hypothetical protein
MRKGPGGVFEADSSLFEMRQAKIVTTTEYRTRVRGTLIGLLRRR